GKPPACPGGIALPKSCQSRNISYEYIGNSKRIITRYGILALGFELSPDYHERTRVMAWRTGFASIAGIGIQWLFWLTQRDIFEDTIEGMRFVGMGFGLLMVLMDVSPGLFLKERRLTAGEAAANLHARHMFAVLQVRPFPLSSGLTVQFLRCVQREGGGREGKRE
ncbi:MAG: MFS transporter, partial [Opitutaceae bacterium]|nr:MFS transporter [Opitutaceae bacterium]